MVSGTFLFLKYLIVTLHLHTFSQIPSQQIILHVLANDVDDDVDDDDDDNDDDMMVTIMI